MAQRIQYVDYQFGISRIQIPTAEEIKKYIELLRRAEIDFGIRFHETRLNELNNSK